jgi:ribosomal protein L13
MQKRRFNRKEGGAEVLPHSLRLCRRLKETKYKKLMAERPEFAMELAVKGMLAKNSLGRWQLDRLKVFKGSEHNHAAQKPENWE